MSLSKPNVIKIHKNANEENFDQEKYNRDLKESEELARYYNSLYAFKFTKERDHNDIIIGNTLPMYIEDWFSLSEHLQKTNIHITDWFQDILREKGLLVSKK